MKNLIGTLLLPFVLFLKFGELNAADNPGPSSGRITGRGGKRPGCGRKPEPRILPARAPPMTRAHDATVHYMDREVRFWLSADGRLEQANFLGMHTADFDAQKVHGLLVGVDVLLGRRTVIYVSRNGTLLAVRAPKPKSEEYLEPSQNEWLIVNGRSYWRLHVNPVQIPSVEGYPFPIYNYEPVSIEIALGGNKRRILKTDIKTRIEYPLGMTFCTYSFIGSKQYPLIMGGFFPKPNTYQNEVELIC